MSVSTQPKPATQRRSQEKRDRILAALDGLLQQHPFAAIGVQDLARAAGVPAATLYQRFRNQDVLGSVLLALYFSRVEDWARRSGGPGPRMAQRPLPEALGVLGADAWDQVGALGHVMRPAYLYSRQHPQLAGTEWQRLEALARTGFESFLAARAGELPAQDLRQSADTLCRLLNGLLLGPLLHAEDPAWASPDARDRFITSWVDLAARYLTAPR